MISDQIRPRFCNVQCCNCRRGMVSRAFCHKFGASNHEHQKSRPKGDIGSWVPHFRTLRPYFTMEPPCCPKPQASTRLLFVSRRNVIQCIKRIWFPSHYAILHPAIPAQSPQLRCRPCGSLQARRKWQFALPWSERRRTTGQHLALAAIPDAERKSRSKHPVQ